MWDIKKMGGIVKSIKDGKTVTAYQLENANDMKNAVAVIHAAKAPKVKAAKLGKLVKPTKKPVVKAATVKTHPVETGEMLEDGEVTSVVDPSFDETSIDDIV
jgi:hypothetical protein